MDSNGEQIIVITGISCAHIRGEMPVIVSPEIIHTPLFYGKPVHPRGINASIKLRITVIIVKHDANRRVRLAVNPVRYNSITILAAITAAAREKDHTERRYNYFNDILHIIII